MATTVKQQAMLAKLDYIIDRNGVKRYIYPMLINDADLVADLYSKLNDEFTVLNLPQLARDADGLPIFDDDGEPVMDTTAFDAMNELLCLALKDTWENIVQWIDIIQAQDILDAYKGLSRLKKKMNMETMVFNGEQ